MKRSYEAQIQQQNMAPAPAPPLAEIPAAVEALGAEVERCGNNLDLLSQRLHPVVCPQPSGSCKEAVPPCAATELGQTLQDICSRVQVIANAITALRESVAL